LESTLAYQGQIRPGVEVWGRSIRDIGAGGDDARAGGAGGRDHVAGGATHGVQAHLAQKIEIVLVEQDDLGLVGPKQAVVFLYPVGQHRIEERHPVPGFAQQRDDLQGGQRRVGFGTQHLLLVQPQVV